MSKLKKAHGDEGEEGADRLARLLESIKVDLVNGAYKVTIKGNGTNALWTKDSRFHERIFS